VHVSLVYCALRSRAAPRTIPWQGARFIPCCGMSSSGLPPSHAHTCYAKGVFGPSPPYKGANCAASLHNRNKEQLSLYDPHHFSSARPHSFQLLASTDSLLSVFIEHVHKTYTIHKQIVTRTISYSIFFLFFLTYKPFNCEKRYHFTPLHKTEWPLQTA
jgi:hypothetical protein